MQCRFDSLCGARAQDATEQFYAGKQVRLYTSVGAASGYSVWAHLVGNYLGRHIPGSPSIVVDSMIGAGGLRAANYMYSVAPKNGQEMLAANGLIPMSWITGGQGAAFDASRFNWLGSPTNETNICVVTKASGIRNVDDLFDKTVIMGTDGVGSGMHIFPTVLNAIFGTKFKIIDGYKDTGEVILAMNRGEIQGICESIATLTQREGDQIKSGDWRVVLQGGCSPRSEFSRCAVDSRLRQDGRTKTGPAILLRRPIVRTSLSHSAGRAAGTGRGASQGS